MKITAGGFLRVQGLVGKNEAFPGRLVTTPEPVNDQPAHDIRTHGTVPVSGKDRFPAHVWQFSGRPVHSGNRCIEREGPDL